MDLALQILQHSIGANRYGEISGNRNHFVTGDGSRDYPVCMYLVERGLMTRREGSAISGGDDIFQATRAGREFVYANSEEPPPLPPEWKCLAPWNEPWQYDMWFSIRAATRSKARYSAFLYLREVNDSLRGKDMIRILVKAVPRTKTSDVEAVDDIDPDCPF